MRRDARRKRTVQLFAPVGITRNASPGTFSSTYSTRVVVGLMLSMWRAVEACRDPILQHAAQVATHLMALIGYSRVSPPLNSSDPIAAWERVSARRDRADLLAGAMRDR